MTSVRELADFICFYVVVTPITSAQEFITLHPSGFVYFTFCRKNISVLITREKHARVSLSVLYLHLLYTYERVRNETSRDVSCSNILAYHRVCTAAPKGRMLDGFKGIPIILRVSGETGNNIHLM